MPRPKTYDESKLLERVMQVFWARGYDQTSIGDLVQATGVNRASLYAAYPDKRALFLAAVEHYLDTVTHENMERLRAVQPAGEAVRGFFLDLVSGQRRRSRRGCLLTNTAVEFGDSDPEVAARVRKAFRKVERVIAERLREVEANGMLAPGVRPEAYARQLVVLIQGIRVMSRLGVERKVLRDAAETALVHLS